LFREEMDSPRGRIHLMKSLAEGGTALTPGVVSHFDSCLGCMACVTACPSGVDYETLLSRTRASIARGYPRGTLERLFRRGVLSLFSRPALLEASLLPVVLYERLGIRELLRRSGLLRLLPRRLRAMEDLLPVARRASPPPRTVPAVGERRARVGLLLGCVQRVFFPEVNAATARVLAAEGCEVVIPRGQPCCGALLVHSGEEEDARAQARRTIEAFEDEALDAVIVNAAGCGSNTKLYGALLASDPAFSERARLFAGKCKDVMEFLAELEPRAPRTPLSLRVVYQDACHLRHAQRIHREPRLMLASIPGIELVEIPESHICCGSAGIYNILEPEAAAELGARKAAFVREAQGDVLVSGNPGCLLQVGAALRREGTTLPLLHTVELLDASLRGLDPRRTTLG
jgi:glycolate oxidase iron-sulfur subunit